MLKINKALEVINAKLVRSKTLGFSDKCDYSIVGDKDAYLKEHKEYIDENGYRRNK